MGPTEHPVPRGETVLRGKPGAMLLAAGVVRPVQTAQKGAAVAAVRRAETAPQVVMVPMHPRR